MEAPEVAASDESKAAPEQVKGEVDENESQALAIAPQPSGVAARRRSDWDKGQTALIKSTVAKDASDGELAMFLEICARYQLDPFAKQIWCARMGGSSGGVTIMVSRDGLLEIANRKGTGFEGLDGDAIYSKDEFLKRHSKDGLVVEHTVKFADPDLRGQLVGAWAMVHRRGRQPTYFHARLDQYKGSDKTPWGKQTDAMILKVAESMALRKAFSISGVVGEDEVAPKMLTASGGESPQIEWPEDESLKDDLQAAFNTLGYTHAKQRLSVNGKSEEELRALLVELGNEADAEVAEEPVEGEVTA